MLSTPIPERADIELLNVSYDVARDFIRLQPFVEHYKAGNPNNVSSSNSHTAAQVTKLYRFPSWFANTMWRPWTKAPDRVTWEKGLVESDWENKFPDNAICTPSTIVFLVRKSNQKVSTIGKTWPKKASRIDIANPKVTGNGRYAFLGAAVASLHAFNKDET